MEREARNTVGGSQAISMDGFREQQVLISKMRSTATSPADLQEVKEQIQRSRMELDSLAGRFSDDDRADLNIVREGGPVAVRKEMEERLKDGNKEGAQRLFRMTEYDQAATALDEEATLTELVERKVMAIESLRQMRDGASAPQPPKP